MFSLDARRGEVKRTERSGWAHLRVVRTEAEHSERQAWSVTSVGQASNERRTDRVCAFQVCSAVALVAEEQRFLSVAHTRGRTEGELELGLVR